MRAFVLLLGLLMMLSPAAAEPLPVRKANPVNPWVPPKEPPPPVIEYEFIEMPPLTRKIGELRQRSDAGDTAAGDEARRLYKGASEEDRAAHAAWSRTVDRYTAERHDPPSR